jgi:hypothetical protein
MIRCLEQPLIVAYANALQALRKNTKQIKTCAKIENSQILTIKQILS